MSNLPVTLTEMFEVVDSFRAAARILARNLRTPALTRREQFEAIVALTQKAWAETELPEIIQGAIAAEARGFLWPDDALAVPPSDVEQALRRLAAENQPRCPTCLRRTPSPPEFALWETRRRVRAAELEAGEKAIP